jgi:hypothetical protein
MITVPWNRLKTRKSGAQKTIAPVQAKNSSDDRPKQFCAVLGSESLVVQDSGVTAEVIAFRDLQVSKRS